MGQRRDIALTGVAVMAAIASGIVADPCHGDGITRWRPLSFRSAVLGEPTTLCSPGTQLREFLERYGFTADDILNFNSGGWIARYSRLGTDLWIAAWPNGTECLVEAGAVRRRWRPNSNQATGKPACPASARKRSPVSSPSCLHRC